MITIPKHIKALIFDLDGTLADSMPIHVESWVRAGKDMGVDITEALVNEYAGTPGIPLVEVLNERFNWSIDPKLTYEKKQFHYRSIASKMTINSIEPIYSFAKQQVGIYPMCLATGSSSHAAMDAINALGMSDWWTAIFTADDPVAGKPSPDIFMACADFMQVPAEHCLVFEDGEAGIQGARDAKMEVVDVKTFIE